ncbi:MAG TPA: ATP phosphoribosyltransferase, partial [Xylella fastidiosa subsp. pauca]
DDGSGTLRVQTMCHGTITWQRLEELERAGAQGLMVLTVERSLA